MNVGLLMAIKNCHYVFATAFFMYLFSLSWQDSSKSYRQICIRFSANVTVGQLLKFRGDRDHRLGGTELPALTECFSSRTFFKVTLITDLTTNWWSSCYESKFSQTELLFINLAIMWRNRQAPRGSLISVWAVLFSRIKGKPTCFICKN